MVWKVMYHFYFINFQLKTFQCFLHDVLHSYDHSIPGIKYMGELYCFQYLEFSKHPSTNQSYFINPHLQKRKLRLIGQGIYLKSYSWQVGKI